MVIALIVAVFAMILLSKCVIVVPDGSVWIVERLGRYFGTRTAGLHVILPFTDRVAHRFSLQPADETISGQCATRDNLPVRVTTVARTKITNPERAAYASADARDSVKTLVRTHQRQAIGKRL